MTNKTITDPRIELDHLIETANKGEEARNKLFNYYKGEFEVVQPDLITIPLYKKVEKTFVPFSVGEFGVKYFPESNVINVGCKSFNANELYKTLIDFLSNYIHSSNVSGNSLFATRHGIKCCEYNISWDNVQKVHDALKKVV